VLLDAVRGSEGASGPAPVNARRIIAQLRLRRKGSPTGRFAVADATALRSFGSTARRRRRLTVPAQARPRHNQEEAVMANRQRISLTDEERAERRK
jgi:hypothetical protein